jgi:hypothetical protein
MRLIEDVLTARVRPKACSKPLVKASAWAVDPAMVARVREAAHFSI